MGEFEKLYDRTKKVDFTGKPIVFISYDTEEIALANFIKDVLDRWTEDKLDVFVAKRAIPPGENPLKMMEQKMKSAQAVIPICSMKSKTSPWIWWESAAVWAKDHNVYPLFTNITAGSFGPPLSLFSQGNDFFAEKEFARTLKHVSEQFKIDGTGFAFNADEMKEFLSLKEKHSKPKTEVDPNNLKMSRNFLSVLNEDLKEYYQLLFEGVNNYLYADHQWVLLNYKDFNTSNKDAMWTDLIKLEVFYSNQEVFKIINKIFAKIKELNEKMKILKPHKDNLNSGSIDVRNYRSLMNEIKSLYILPKGVGSSYEESTIGEFFVNTLKALL